MRSAALSGACACRSPQVSEQKVSGIHLRTMAGIVSKVFAFCCSNKRNNDVDDSNVDAVIARNLWKNHRILPPTSRFKQNWDLFMVCTHVAEQKSCYPVQRS